MAELIWKGKSSPHRYSITEQKHTIPPKAYQLVTKEHYPPQPENQQPQEPSVSPERWYNRLIHGDNQYILPSLLHEFAASINLIYVDPPFMTGRTFINGTDVAYSDTWANDLDSYLPWLYDNLQLLYNLLSPTGSFYLHLDWRTIHYAKIMLDEIFGYNPHGNGPGFKNEIIWHYQSGGGQSKNYYARKHDTILLYTKSARYCFYPERVAERRGTQKRNHMRKEINTDGRISWTIRSAGRIYTYNEDSLIIPSDVWSNINHLHQKDPERSGYATQKPEALLERIILASSEQHDLVLDCFCGSGVTPAVAERLNRRWIACDRSDIAIAKTRERLLAQEMMHPFITQQING